MNARLLLGWVVVGLAAAPCARASPAEILELLNRMRAAPAPCEGSARLQRFARRAALDQVASRLARGAALRESTQGTGYQALPVRSISMSGSTRPEVLERLLAKNYCPAIVDPGLADVGVHQQGTSTWVVLAPAFDPGGGLDAGALSARLLELVNLARAQQRQCGDRRFAPAGPLRWSETLERAARAHSIDMARNGYFAHVAPGGSTPADRVTRAGYDYRRTGENIAAGQSTADDAVAAWLASPVHCANLMDPAYTEMGAALETNRRSPLGTYWTQVFGLPRAASRRR